MHEHAPITPPSDPPGKARAHRARSLPSARPFLVAVVFCSLHYLGLIASLTALVSFLMRPGEAATRILVGGMVFSAVTWLIAFFKRRATYCPLCKGTPLINTGARTHVRAQRIFPFNHGVSASLSILATHKFRCMYCGSDYDLLKPPTRLLYGDSEPSVPAASQPHDNPS